MRVIYGQEVNTVVDDSTNPDDIMATLKESFAELSRGEYTISTEGGEQVMRITLKSGSKA